MYHEMMWLSIYKSYWSRTACLCSLLLGADHFSLSGRFKVNTSVMDKNIAQRIIHALMIPQLGMLLLGSRHAYVASIFLNFLIFIPFLIGFHSPPPFFYNWFINPLALNIPCTQHTAWSSKCQMSCTGAFDIHLVASLCMHHLNSGMLHITLGI